jgi:glycosyltransferase involved in cell wall biosynthesis
MKVLFVASGNSSQGISPIIRNQGESLQKAGLTIGFYAINGRGLKGYIKSISDLRKTLSSDNYDIVHAHYGLSAIVALFARNREKLVVSFMGDDLVGANRMDGSVKLSSKLIVALNKLLSRFFYEFCIVKSEDMYNNLHIKHKALIPNGIDMKKFYQIDRDKALRETGLENKDKLVLFVSDPTRPEKNFKLASEAVKLIENPSVHLFSANGIENSYLVYYYNATDVLVLTSFHEGSPNVIKEAMACNCPIVSTDVGDVKWVIGNTEGCYITSYDPSDVSYKIKLAIEFREKHVQTKGRERIIELGLDSETVANKIVNVYKRVLENDA